MGFDISIGWFEEVDREKEIEKEIKRRLVEKVRVKRFNMKRRKYDCQSARIQHGTHCGGG